MSEDEQVVGDYGDLDAFAGTSTSLSPYFVPTASQEKCLGTVAEGDKGEMRLVILEGPRGEGKTATGLLACMELAGRVSRAGRANALPLRVACVRDTFINLQRTTLVSIEEMGRKDINLVWRDGRRECIVLDHEGLQPMVHIYFFGLDRPADAGKLQGFVMGLLWLEEVATADGLDTGIPADVLALGGTSLRQPGIAWPRILVTMNSPDDDHWIGKVEEELEQRDLTEIKVFRIMIPAGEKSRHFRALAQEAPDETISAIWTESAVEFDAYRKRNRVLLESIGRHDLVTRLVEGKRGGVQLGEPVVPNFSLEHISREALPVFRSIPLVRGWDNEPSPAVCIYQALPEGRGVNVLGSHVEENATMEQLIKGWLLPWLGKTGLLTRPNLATSSWGRGPKAGLQWKDVCDPVLLDTQLTAGQVIQGLLSTSLTPGPVGWEDRRSAAIACFERGARGGRRFMLVEEPENKTLVQGLQSKFRCPRDQSTGRIVMTAEAAKRVSGKWSNPCDALFYALAVDYPAAEWLRKGMARPAPPPRWQPKTYMGA